MSNVEVLNNAEAPSKAVLKNQFDGVILEDALGHKIRLRKPSILDRYDLFSAMEGDANNPACLQIAVPLMHIATYNNHIVEPARSISEFRANLKLVGDEGIATVMEYLIKITKLTDEDVKEVVKK